MLSVSSSNLGRVTNSSLAFGSCAVQQRELDPELGTGEDSLPPSPCNVALLPSSEDCPSCSILVFVFRDMLFFYSRVMYNYSKKRGIIVAYCSIEMVCRIGL